MTLGTYPGEARSSGAGGDETAYGTPVDTEGKGGLQGLQKQYRGGGDNWFLVCNTNAKFNFELSLTSDLDMAADPTGVQFSPLGEYLAVSCITSVQVFDANILGPALLTVLDQAGEIDHRNRRICFSPDRRHVALGSTNALIRIGDLHEKTLTTCLRGHTSSISSLCYSHDGMLLVSGSMEDRTVRVWDMNSFSEYSRISLGNINPIGLMTFSPTGDVVAVSDGNSNVSLIDTASGNRLRSLNSPTRVDPIVFSPCGQQIVGILMNELDHTDHTPILWRADEQGSLTVTGSRPLTSRILEHSMVNSVSWSADARWLITGGNRPMGSVQFWDPLSGEPQFILNVHDGTGKNPQFHSDALQRSWMCTLLKSVNPALLLQVRAEKSKSGDIMEGHLYTTEDRRIQVEMKDTPSLRSVCERK